MARVSRVGSIGRAHGAYIVVGSYCRTHNPMNSLREFERK